MYSGKVGILARKLVNKGKSESDALKEIEDYVTSNKGHFNHLNDSTNTMDIAANTNRNTSHSNFLQSFATYKNVGVLISSNKSIERGQKGEANAYHTVFR